MVLMGLVDNGSPVPHTVVAKSTNLAPLSPTSLLRDFLLFPFTLITGNAYHRWVFLPAYAGLGGWHYTLRALGTALGLAAAFSWVVPLVRPWTRMLSLAFYLSLFFVGNVVREVYPWYLPTVATFGYLTIGLMFDQLMELVHHLPRLGWDRGWFRHLVQVLSLLSIVLIAGQALVTVLVARQMSIRAGRYRDGNAAPDRALVARQRRLAE